MTRIQKLEGYDPVLSVDWVHSTNIVETPDGHHVFRDKERFDCQGSAGFLALGLSEFL